MIDDDPFAPPARVGAPFESRLENASIEDLEAAIAHFRERIGQCEAAIAKKRAQRAAADSVFGSKSS